MCWHAGLINLAKCLRAFLDAACREGFVDGEINAGYLAAIHALECDKVPAFVGHGDAHWHTDFLGHAARTCDQHSSVFDA